MRSMKPASEPCATLLRLLIGALILLTVVAALSACTRTVTVTEEKFTKVPIMVPTACVGAQGRPDQVAPLNRRVSGQEWVQRAPGAKAKAMQAQAGRRMNYADELAAATSACP